MILLFIGLLQVASAGFNLKHEVVFDCKMQAVFPKAEHLKQKFANKRAEYKLIESKCDKCPENVARYIENECGEKLLKVPSAFSRLLWYSAYKNRLIFSGDSQFGIITIIVDAKDFKIIDILLHFALSDDGPMLQSPSGRYLIFKKFYPRVAVSEATSDFIMIYDLEKPPSENRIYGNFCKINDITIENANVMQFFYPENANLEYSKDLPYNTFVENIEKQIYLRSTGWNIDNKVLVVSEKSRTRNYKIIVVDEDSGVIKKRVFNLAALKLFDKFGKRIDFDSKKDFFMGRVEFVENEVIIYNGSENPAFYAAKLKEK